MNIALDKGWDIQGEKLIKLDFGLEAEEGYSYILLDYNRIYCGPGDFIKDLLHNYGEDTCIPIHDIPSIKKLRYDYRLTEKVPLGLLGFNVNSGLVFKDIDVAITMEKTEYHVLRNLILDGTNYLLVYPSSINLTGYSFEDVEILEGKLILIEWDTKDIEIFEDREDFFNFLKTKETREIYL